MSLTASTYDPDGLQSILTGADVDWDDSSMWDLWPWVTYGVVDASVAGPVWGDMDTDAQELWYEENKDLVESRLGDMPSDIEFGSSMSSFVYPEEHAAIVTLYDNLRQQGAMGGTEIDYSYYQNDSLYALAWATIDWEKEDLDAPDWTTPGEGVTQEHLQVATEYIGRTFRSVANDQYRMPWDAELPGKWEPVEMETDYETPFDIPGIVQGLSGPSMSPSLQAVKARSGSDMAGQFNTLQANTPNQTGFVPKIPETSAAPEVAGNTVNPYEHIDISNLQFQDKYVMKTAGDLGLDNADLAKRWAVVAGVGNLNSTDDINTIKNKYEQLNGKLPKTSI